MNLPEPCRYNIGTMCPQCGFVHEQVAAFPDEPATNVFVDTLRDGSDSRFVDVTATVPIESAVGFEQLDGDDVEWVAVELVVTDGGRSRTIAYTDRGWVVTSVLLHEPTDTAKAIHDCVLALAEVSSPGDRLDDLPSSS